VEDFRGRVALITGACGGIGAAISRRFASAGASLALCDVRAEPLVELAKELSSQGATIHHAAVDVTDEPSVRAFCASSSVAFGGLDVLVNTVGVVDDVGSVLTLPTEGWHRSIEVNLTSAFLIAKHAVPLMRERAGVIANISSVSGLANQADAMVYSVTKAGLVSLTKSEAIDLAPMGIRAVAICPGSVETPLVEQAIEQMAQKSRLTADEQRRIWEAQYPTGRFSTPEEVADLTLFLCSERAKNISGSAVIIDGGLTAVLPER
jgi:meso-butanediol dehydrogenase/(S,S)-butanediol dehydrogenase/diacetyl reductase